MMKALLLLVFAYPFTFAFTSCFELIQKLTNPPPAIQIIQKNGKLNYELIDPRERQTLITNYRKETEKIYELLTEYITKRKELEEIERYLSWQWKRVEIGIEYRKDIWKEQIQHNKERQKLKSIELQLLLYGATQEDLERCYQSFYKKQP